MERLTYLKIGDLLSQMAGAKKEIQGLVSSLKESRNLGSLSADEYAEFLREAK